MEVLGVEKILGGRSHIDLVLTKVHRLGSPSLLWHRERRCEDINIVVIGGRSVNVILPIILRRMGPNALNSVSYDDLIVIAGHHGHR